MGMFNTSGGFNPGQFMQGMYDNWQTNQYNNQVDTWQQQQNQYNQDLDYWNQMNDYDQQNQSYNMWSSGAARGTPIMPRQMPMMPSMFPNRPESSGGGGGWGGGGGGGGFNPTAPPGGGGGGFDYGAFDGAGYQAGDPWSNPGIDTAGMVDPSAVIASAQPGIMEKMNVAFADAGNRFGSSGMVGTPYSDSLGAASRGAANDIANVTNQYQFAAAQSQADREQQRAMAEYGADFNAWSQQGDWAHQGQLADMNQDFNAWGQMGDWQNQQALQGGDLANQQWFAQNNWNFQNQQQQQQMQQQMMQQMMMQMFGGGGF